MLFILYTARNPILKPENVSVFSFKRKLPKVDMKRKFLFSDMIVQAKLERRPFLDIFSGSRDIGNQRSVKLHQQWFTYRKNLAKLWRKRRNL